MADLLTNYQDLKRALADAFQERQLAEAALAAVTNRASITKERYLSLARIVNDMEQNIGEVKIVVDKKLADTEPSKG